MNDVNYLSNIPREDIYSTFEIHPNQEGQKSTSSQSVSSQASAGSVSSDEFNSASGSTISHNTRSNSTSNSTSTLEESISPTDFKP